MKTKIKRHSRAVISVILAISMLVSCMMVGIIATDAAYDNSEALGWGVQANHRIYFVNRYNWNGVQIRVKENDNSSWYDMGQISGTGVYSHWIGSDWIGSQGLEFRQKNDNNNKTSVFGDWVTENKVYWYNSAAAQGQVSSVVNGTAKIVSMISDNGSTYTKSANADCVATISSKNLPDGYSETTDTSASTGTNSEVECYPVYGATINYSAEATGDYEFVGFSTTESASLPSVSATYSTWSPYFADNTTNAATVYAYFRAKAAYYVTGTTQLVGSSAAWDNDAPQGKMSLSSGTTYTKTFYNVPAGTHKFRIADGTNCVTTSSNVTVTGNASAALGTGTDADNICFTTSEAKDVTITFNTAQSSSKYPVTVNLSAPKTWVKTNGSIADISPSSYVDATNNYIVMYSNSSLTGGSKSVTLKHIDNNSSFYWAEITPDNSGLWDNQKWLFWSSNTSSSGIQGNSGTTSKINGTTASDTAVEFKDSQNNYLFKVQKNSGDDKRPLLIHKVSDKVAKIGVRVSNTSGTVNYEFYYQLATPAEEDPDVTVTTVDIYAKDGTLRDGYQKFSEFAQTTITAIKNADGTNNTTALAAVKRYNYQNTGTNISQTDDTNSGSTRYDYAKATGIPVGSTITVRTRLYQESQWGGDWYGSNFNDTHYVKAFCVNGVAPEVYTWKDATGSNTYTDYEMTYTITEEDVALDRSNKGYIEITPIIYLKDSTYTKTFYIEGYDRDDERYKTLGWGTTLGIYPYYDGKKESENGFGGYPGQPMLFYKGRYEIQVPLTHDGTSSGAKCLGITLSNNYWDELHRSLDKSIKNDDTGHRQTYDFDDFYKIKEEKNPDQITFSFKLRTNEANNFDDGYDRDNFNYADHTEKTLYRNTTTNVLYKSNKTDVFSENGIDEYKDGLNRDINLFGTVLSADQAAQPKLLVVSNGYKYTYVGKYATEWVVYKNDGADAQTGMTKYTYVTQIAPSALVLNSLDSFSAYTGGSSTTAATKPKPLGNYQAAYTTLSGADYVDRAFEICYESSQYISQDDKADRLDGRWLYTKNGDKISATVKIQYKNSTYAEWTDEASYTTGYDSKNNKGAVTNAQAYFTNVTPKDLDGLMTAADIPIVPGSYFTFKTVAPTDQEHMNYVFRGWYVSLNGSDPVAIDKAPQLESMLEMTGNAVIIARYEELTSGVLTIRHDIETNSTYKGTGTPYLKVELLNGSNQVKDTYAMTANGQYLTTKYLTTAYASNNYKFRITLKAVGANSDNTYVDTTESGSLNTMSMAPTSGTVNSNDGKYFTVPISSLFTDGTLTVTSLVYKTHFNLTEYNYKYVINYKFPTRLYGDEVYKVESGNISGNKMSAYFDGTKETAKVKKNIISGNTPFESNFMKKMNWDYDTAYSGTISSATDYANGGQIVTPTTIGTSTTYTVYVTVIADDNTELNVNAFFMLPYQYNETTKAAISYDVYDGKNTYDSSKDRGSGSDKYELYIDGEREFNNLSDAELKAQTTNRKYLMYDESAAENSPRRVFDNLVPLTSASTTTQNGEDKIVGYDNTVSGFTLSAPMGTLITYDGVNNLGKESHFVRAPEYIYVADGDTTQKDSWQHLSYGNVDYHTIRETTTFRTHDVTTNAQYVSYNNVKDGIVANEGYTKKYFSRWDIYSQSDSRYVASCYYYDFNYTSYEDIYVVPVYESSKPSAFIDEALDKNNMATVSFLDTTRNQWNVKVDPSAPNEVADKLYTDFALSFGDGSTILSELKSTDTKKVRVGMLIERLDGLTGADTTKFATDTDSNVITAASSYVKAFDNNAKEAIANMLINDEGANSATYKSTEAALYGNAANCKIASNDDWTTRDLTALDNKNRIEYYYGINKLLGTTGYKNYKYAYRAISYILVDNGSGWSAKISDPAYFTIYDTATQTVAG